MKKCEYFKDLILTDYIDGVLDKIQTGNLENHLLDCSDCRAFFKEVKQNVSMPIQLAKPQKVPVELWDTIKQRVENESTVTNSVADFMEQLKGLLVFPKIVPVFASLILMLLVGSVSLNTIQLQQARDKDQGEYLVSLLSASSTSLPTDNNDGATPIEHYFL